MHYIPAVTLLPASAAAERLGISYSTLKQWIYQGGVRTVRTRGGHHRVPLAEIERILADQGRLSNHRRTAPRGADPPVLLALSTRNQLRGIVEEVRTDGLLAQVRLRIGDELLTAVITRDAVQALGLKRGHPAIALIKATEVMIGCEPAPAKAAKPQRTRRRPPGSASTR
jgi:molybdopterin-binding protein